MIKNNLTYIYPLKLTGSSGRGIFKITDISVPYVNTLDDKLSFRSPPIDETGADISFNLDMKHDLFKVKLDYMTNQQLSQQLKSNYLGNDKLTVKNVALIRTHKRTFRISNVGNFPTEITAVTLENDGNKHNGFSLKKLDDGRYEITYEPNFRHSKVTEVIKVVTKNSISKFKVQAYIPMYLIKFIDSHFRLTEIEEHLGNWYYLIIISFLLLTLLLLGTEIVEYIIFLKQKNINYTLITELITAYKRANELSREERKGKQANEILSSSASKNIKNMPSKHSFIKSNEIEEDPRAQIEEIKKRLADKIDFSDIRSDSSTSNKKPAKQNKKLPATDKVHERNEKYYFQNYKFREQNETKMVKQQSKTNRKFFKINLDRTFSI